MARARAAGLGWPLPEGMDEEGLEATLFFMWPSVWNMWIMGAFQARRRSRAARPESQ